MVEEPFLTWRNGDVTELGLFALCEASQKLKHQGLQQRKGLFMKQASEEMGEQISNPPP